MVTCKDGTYLDLLGCKDGRRYGKFMEMGPATRDCFGNLPEAGEAELPAWRGECEISENTIANTAIDGATDVEGPKAWEQTD